MRLGLHVVNFDLPGGPATIAPALAEVGRIAEDVGLDNLSVMDHWFQMENLGGPAKPMLEGYTTLGFLAAHTSTVELQLLVTGVTYRHPGLLAKQVATLDVLSGGRAMLGIGAAWYEREHLGLGVPFPPLSERFERLEEALQIVRQMYSLDNGAYQGRHYQLAETACVPLPLHQVPVMIGGSGERKTLRLVAQYADACNLFCNPQIGPEGIALKLDVLRAHCIDVGRPYDDIRKTVLWVAPVDPAEGPDGAFLGHLAELADVGVDEVHVMDFGNDPVGFLRGLGEHVVPSAKRL